MQFQPSPSNPLTFVLQAAVALAIGACAAAAALEALRPVLAAILPLAGAR